MIKQAALAVLLLAAAVAGCEHPSEPNGSAEMRAGIDGLEEGERPKRGVPEQSDRAPEGTMMPPPGPRTNTPGGAASDLHSG